MTIFAVVVAVAAVVTVVAVTVIGGAIAVVVVLQLAAMLQLHATRARAQSGRRWRGPLRGAFRQKDAMHVVRPGIPRITCAAATAATAAAHCCCLPLLWGARLCEAYRFVHLPYGMRVVEFLW